MRWAGCGRQSDVYPSCRNSAQIAKLALPTAPPKKSDRRAFEGETVQAEALPPDVLTEIVRQAVIDRQDADIRQDVLDQEQADRAELHDLIGEW